MPRVNAPGPNSKLVPLCVAAGEIGLSVKMLRRVAVDHQEFTLFRPTGQGKGAVIWLFRDELQAYLDGQVPGLREFRASRRRTLNGESAAKRSKAHLRRRPSC